MYKFNKNTVDSIIDYLKQNHLVNNEKLDENEYQKFENGFYDWFKKQNENLRNLVNQAMFNVSFSDINGNWGKAKSEIEKIIDKIKKRLGVTALDPVIEKNLYSFLEFKMVTGVRDWEKYKEQKKRDEQYYFKMLNSILELKLFNQKAVLEQQRLSKSYQSELNNKKTFKKKLVSRYLLSNGIEVFINGDMIELDLAAGVNLKDLSLCIEQMANLSERSGANQLLFKCSNNNDLSSIKKLVNYQAIVSNLIFKFGTVDDDNNILSEDLSAGSRLRATVKQNSDEIHEGINLSDNLGMYLRANLTDRYWQPDLKDQITRRENEEAISYALNSELIDPFNFKYGLKYGNRSDNKERLRKIKKALKNNEEISAEDLEYFKKNSEIVAKGKNLEFQAEQHCKMICDDLLKFRPTVENNNQRQQQQKKKQLVNNAANLVFAKMLEGKMGDTYLEKIINSEYGEEILERVDKKIQAEKKLFGNLDLHKKLSNLHEKLSKKCGYIVKSSVFGLR